jgi:adenosylcobinamide-phosphate synthase
MPPSRPAVSVPDRQPFSFASHSIVKGHSGRALGLLAGTIADAVLGGASLADEALRIAKLPEAGDLTAARLRLPALCGGDPANLDAAQIARAVVESVAESTCDAMVAPLAWGAACGLPGLLGQRAVNTLDAMIGHYSSRYERFGWAAARPDDLAAFVPARLTAMLAVAPATAVAAAAAVVLSEELR